MAASGWLIAGSVFLSGSGAPETLVIALSAAALTIGAWSFSARSSTGTAEALPMLPSATQAAARISSGLPFLKRPPLPSSPASCGT